jgi:uncharacterized membrane protein YccC
VSQPAVEQNEARREPPPMIGPADHPQAATLIRRAKGWGGIGGFALTAFTSWVHGGVVLETCLRALVGGIAGYLIAWTVAVSIGRTLLKAQGQLAIERVLETRRRMAEERLEAARRAAEEAGDV